MQVKDLSVREAVWCRPEDSLERAAQLMWEHDCGCVPVVDADRRPVGMLTDRDLSMTAYLRGRPLAEVGVHEVMARDVRCCREDDSLDVAHGMMREHQVRRLPVVGAQGDLVGVVSLADLARSVERESRGEPRRKAADELATTLLSVSRPRTDEDAVLVPRRADAREQPRAARGTSTAKTKQAKTKRSKK